MLAGLLALGSLSLTSFYNKLVDEKKEQLTKITDTVFSQINEIKRATPNEEEAKAKVIAYVKSVRYGKDNYFWINSTQPKMIAHPINSALEGADLSQKQDAAGVYMFQEMTKAAQNGTGFVSYQWNRPNAKTSTQIDRVINRRQISIVIA